ncbi:hypothetical protein FHU40_000779 [Nocardioides soli]|uniref:Uncharacterized protein n=1 Tax=Nocardioides soli TaxID=1036020 RepID=A0A7W4VT22_9ACTN|nr:hypothetical protein [Nocardioides soli]
MTDPTPSLPARLILAAFAGATIAFGVAAAVVGAAR